VLTCAVCLFLLAFLSLDAIATAGTSRLPTVAGDVLLTDESLERFQIEGRQRELATSAIVDTPDQRFSKVLRVTTARAAQSEWNVQLVASMDSGVKSGDVLLARFWMRCLDSLSGEGFITFVYEMSYREFDKAAETRVGAGAEWTECCVPFRAPRDFPAGESQVCFRVGNQAQTIEIAGLQLINFGNTVKLQNLPRARVSYSGRDPDASWRAAAEARIEKHRKADLTINVIDASGRPVPRANVHIQLKRHAFHFGSCVATDYLLDPSSDGRRYRDIVEKNFNWAVFENEMKWQALADGISPSVDQALRWLQDRKIDVRGHNLFWPGWRWLPEQLRKFQHDPHQLRSMSRKHALDVVRHFKGKLLQWDVVNEPYTNHDLIDLLGGPAVMVDWFNFAHQADPDCKLYLNDYGILEGGPEGAHSQHFYDAIKFLMEKGAPIHGVGIQSHFGAALPSPMQVLSTLDKFSELGLPIELTEISFNLDDRSLQADYLRDFFIAAFSHPNVHGLMLWGFWEQRHWRPDSALFNADWSIRPHGQAWIDSVHNKWKTDIRSSTDADGKTQVRGFLGDYSISVSTGARLTTGQLELNSQGGSITLMVP
jgi:endo-1,4-beta-xylanase